MELSPHLVYAFVPKKGKGEKKGAQSVSQTPGYSKKGKDSCPVCDLDRRGKRGGSQTATRIPTLKSHERKKKRTERGHAYRQGGKKRKVTVTFVTLSRGKGGRRGAASVGAPSLIPERREKEKGDGRDYSSKHQKERRACIRREGDRSVTLGKGKPDLRGTLLSKGGRGRKGGGVYGGLFTELPTEEKEKGDLPVGQNEQRERRKKEWGYNSFTPAKMRKKKGEESSTEKKKISSKGKKKGKRRKLNSSWHSEGEGKKERETFAGFL